jgi:hypothetical protein
MPGANQVPEDARESSAIVSRTEKLERRVGRDLIGPMEPVIFSHPGAVIADTESPPWYATVPTVITEVLLASLAAPSVSIVVEVRVSGAAIAQFTLTSGTTSTVTATNIVVVPGVPLTVKIISGTGADLSVFLKRRRR